MNPPVYWTEMNLGGYVPFSPFPLLLLPGARYDGGSSPFGKARRRSFQIVPDTILSYTLNPWKSALSRGDA